MSTCEHGMANAVWCQHCIAATKAEARKTVVKEAARHPKVKRVAAPDSSSVQELATLRGNFRILTSGGTKYTAWTPAATLTRCKSCNARIERGQPLIKSLVRKTATDGNVWVCSMCWRNEGGDVQTINDESRDQ